MTEKKSAWSEKTAKYYRVSTYFDRVEDADIIKWLKTKTNRKEVITKAIRLFMEEEIDEKNKIK